MKKKRIIMILAALSFLAGRLHAAPVSYKLESSSSVQFEVTSTLHEVHGISTPGPAEIIFDTKTSAVTGGFVLRIPVNSLSTGNAARDRAMMEMFDSTHYPAIEWTAEEILCKADAPRAWLCEARGTLSIHGKANPENFSVTIKESDGQLTARGEARVLLPAFDLHPPSVLNIIKVASEVHIHFETLWSTPKK